METAAALKLGRMRKAAESKADKRTEKRRELAESAVMTLAQLGYANTSLRDIASQTGVSVGVIHYYFVDKSDLISYCVQQYKAEFVSKMMETVKATGPKREVIAGFVDGLARTIREDADMHRLWYDIRTQAMFDENFRSIVNEIEEALIGIVVRLLDRIETKDVDPIDAYTALDGRFRYCLQQYVEHKEGAISEFRAALERLFRSFGHRD